MISALLTAISRVSNAGIDETHGRRRVVFMLGIGYLEV